jgi:large subunit ribosomal protein L21
MFAVIKTGGKQYRVASGDVIKIERLAGDAGSNLNFDDVLLVGDEDKITTGTPIVAGAKVTGEILEQARGDKVIIFKKKRRQNYRRKAGHRQNLTVVRITDIAVGAKKKAAAKKAEAAAPDADAAASEE